MTLIVSHFFLSPQTVAYSLQLHHISQMLFMRTFKVSWWKHVLCFCILSLILLWHTSLFVSIAGGVQTRKHESEAEQGEKHAEQTNTIYVFVYVFALRPSNGTVSRGTTKNQNVWKRFIDILTSRIVYVQQSRNINCMQNFFTFEFFHHLLE